MRYPRSPHRRASLLLVAVVAAAEFIPSARARAQGGGDADTARIAVARAYPEAARFLAERAPGLGVLSVAARRPLLGARPNETRGDTLLLVRAEMSPAAARARRLSADTGAVLAEGYGAFVVRGGRVKLTLGLIPAGGRDARGYENRFAVAVDAVGPRAVTISRRDDSYGMLKEKVTYLLDPGADAPTLAGWVVHQGLAVGAMAATQDTLFAAVRPYRAGRAGGVLVAVVPPRGGAEQTPRVAAVLDAVGGAPVPAVGAARAVAGTVVFYGDSVALVRDARGGWSRRPLPAAAELLRLPSGDALGLGAAPRGVVRALSRLPTASELATRVVVRQQPGGEGAAVTFFVHDGIHELAPAGGAPQRLHTVPVPSYEHFARARPGRVADGYTRDHAELEARVGAFAVERDTLWFGTSFYDGEGTTGVGAVGSFALATQRYATRYPPALADWSTSALATDGDALWLGLVRHPEGADWGGGVLRYDRRTGGARHYEVPGVVTALVAWRGTVYAGTDDGIYALVGGRFAPLPLGFDAGGRVVVR